MPPRTIEELLVKHFRRSKSGKYTQREEPGEPITPEQAAEYCKGLTDRQRAGIDPDTIEALDILLDEDAIKGGRSYIREAKKLESYALFKARRSPELERTWTTLAALKQLTDTNQELSNHYVGRNTIVRNCIGSVRDATGKRSLKLDENQVFATLDSAVRHKYDDPAKREYDYGLLHVVMGALERLRGQIKPTGADVERFKELRDQYKKDAYGAPARSAVTLLDEILTRGAGDTRSAEADPAQTTAAVKVDVLWEKEPWAKQINDSIRALLPKQQSAAVRLLQHAGSNSEYNAKPSKSWFAAARAIAQEMGADDARKLVASWLQAFAADPRELLAEQEERFHTRPADRRDVLRPHLRQNTGYLAGLAHVARVFQGPEVLPILADLVEHVAKATHHVRENSASVAMAAMRSIEASDDPLAAATLSRLALRLRWPKLRKAAEKLLDDYTKRKGVSRDDTEEASIPDFGMIGGSTKIEIGDSHAEITVARGDRPRLTWHPPGKQPTHIVSKALKQSHPDEVKSVQNTIDEIEKMLAAQRTRIDLLFRRETRWPYATWRERYLDHGLVGTLTRRLIWLLDDVPALHVNNDWQDAHGKPVSPSTSATVSLWHPAMRSADEVLDWRNRLEALEITQPIKQAHREVYLLTEAERRTRTYSNRFAAHIVRNHATLAISQVRKWKMGMAGTGDSAPRLALPHFKLRAEWWVEPAGEEHDRMGFPLFLVTDQVRFYEDNEADPMLLENVPPLALTEVMRDIDLFVSIASVGNDPTWQDGGPQGQYREYWQRYSFGELSQTAQTRRAALASLLPRLSKIRERCSLADRFLIVKGDIRTYKIHLGSGNILMSPNDQYLCIVPDARARSSEGSNILLPFEGDTTLSVILSKAFLLANDTTITDETITRQIGTKR